jgi:hypothetical protein
MSGADAMKITVRVLGFQAGESENSRSGSPTPYARVVYMSGGQKRTAVAFGPKAAALDDVLTKATPSYASIDEAGHVLELRGSFRTGKPKANGQPGETYFRIDQFLHLTGPDQELYLVRAAAADVLERARPLAASGDPEAAWKLVEAHLAALSGSLQHSVEAAPDLDDAAPLDDQPGSGSPEPAPEPARPVAFAAPADAPSAVDDGLNGPASGQVSEPDHESAASAQILDMGVVVEDGPLGDELSADEEPSSEEDGPADYGADPLDEDPALEPEPEPVPAPKAPPSPPLRQSPPQPPRMAPGFMARRGDAPAPAAPAPVRQTEQAPAPAPLPQPSAPPAAKTAAPVPQKVSGGAPKPPAPLPGMTMPPRAPAPATAPKPAPEQAAPAQPATRVSAPPAIRRPMAQPPGRLP